MATPWTAEQVSGLAPDAASIGAGRKLGSAAKWQTLGQDDRLIWGEIKGSGSKPYQACIDTAGPAFKCSCPSRKFPCKHGLGLAFAHADSADAFTAAVPPDWVADWVGKRAERAERQAKREETAGQPVDETTERQRRAAQAKRREARQDKMQAGLDELQRWLADTLRQGLARAMEQSEPWDHMAARLVDAQTPGLARWLREAQDARYGSVHWQDAALRRLARLQAILDAYRRREALGEALQADLSELMGVPLSKDLLLAQTGVSDTWRIVGKRSLEEERLQTQRTWLCGERSGRLALLLEFAAAGAVLPIMPEEGAAIEAELVFYPGSWPLRALIKAQSGLAPVDSEALTASFGSLDALYAAYAARLAQTPWLERMPAGLRGLTPCMTEDALLLLDRDRKYLPVARQFPLRWELLAISGGHSLDLFGEWDGESFFPLTVVRDARIHGLDGLHKELT